MSSWIKPSILLTAISTERLPSLIGAICIGDLPIAAIKFCAFPAGGMEKLWKM
jgi:hypothetical protein